MTNPNNNGTIVGRVAADAVVFRNGDDSHSVKLSVYADNDFKNRDGSYGSQRLPVQSDYIRPDVDYTKIAFSSAREGDLVSIATHTESFESTDKETGRTNYGVAIVIDGFRFLESRGVRDARAAEKAQKKGQPAPAQTKAPVAQAPVAQAQPVQGPPAWATEQGAAQQPVAAAAPVAVPAQAQAAAAPVAVPAQTQVAVPARAMHDDPPF